MTGEGGNCGRWNRAEASASPAPGALEWKVFKVPPGAYTLAWTTNFGTLGHSIADDAFSVPKGAAVYVGDFVRLPDTFQPTLPPRVPGEIRRSPGDLAGAKAAFPAYADRLQRARTISIPSIPRRFICTP